MLKYFIAPLLFLFLGCIFVHAQVPHRNFSLRNYTAVHGLPQSQVIAVVEDKNGYLWMATWGGGLARFDGKEFKVYTTLDGLLSNIIANLTIDEDQNLWIVHPRGLTRFDGVNFKKFRATEQLSKREMVRRAFVFSDTVFITSAPGVLGKIYKDSVYYWSKAYEKDKLVMRVHQLTNGQLCIFLNDGRIILKTEKGDLNMGFLPKGNKISNIYNYGDEVRMCLYSMIDYTMATYKLDLANQQLVPCSENIRGNVIFFDSGTKTYWLRDGQESLLTLQEGKSTPEVVLEDVGVNQVLPDREGNIWIASNGAGLFKYAHQDFSKCTSENMRGVMSMLIDNEDATWIGTMSKGLWRIKDGKINSFTDEKEPARNGINCIAQAPNGDIWVGAVGGLAKLDIKTNKFLWYTPRDGLSAFSVFNISFDEKGNLWVGTPAGLNYFDGKKFTHIKTE
ncbi:MAG TPA: two-component regulator propeller domain-containing protein, partial [Cyclobacteriaceae bacterium]